MSVCSFVQSINNEKTALLRVVFHLQESSSKAYCIDLINQNTEEAEVLKIVLKMS